MEQELAKVVELEAMTARIISAAREYINFKYPLKRRFEPGYRFTPEDNLQMSREIELREQALKKAVRDAESMAKNVYPSGVKEKGIKRVQAQEQQDGRM